MINVMMNLCRRLPGALGKRSFQVGVLFLALLFYSTTGFMYFELPEKPDLAWSDALWWSIVTMTTVGYGDFFPETTLGRMLVGFPTMLLGVGVLGYGLSLVASAMIESRLLEAKGMKAMHLTDHIIICNFNSVEKALQLVREIHEDSSTRDAHIVIVDKDLDELPAELAADYVHFVKGDPSRKATLDQANLATCKAVLIQADTNDINNSDDKNLKACLTIEATCPQVFTVVECVKPENVVFFRRCHCDSVISMASLTGQMMIQELQDPGVNTIVSELTSNATGKQIYITKLKTPATNFRDVREMYKDENCILLGIRREEENHILPEPGFAVHPGDQAILISDRRP